MGEAANIDAFLKAAGWQNASRHPLAGDASSRRYERLRLGDQRRVLMVSPPAPNDMQARFVTVTDLLRRAGLSAPRIHAREDATGLALIEDLGDALFSSLIRDDGLKDRLIAAADVIAVTSTLKSAAPQPGTRDLIKALNPLRDWMPDVDRAAFDDFAKTLEPHLDRVMQQPTGLSLRDFHAGNLIWRPDRAAPANVGLLDYQDAIRIHPAYDLVSLLIDARIAYDDDTISAVKAHFVQQTHPSEAAFEHAFATLTVQRNARILGIFSRLARRDKKPGYLKFMPHTWASIAKAVTHPDLDALQDAFHRAVPRPDERTVERLVATCP